MTCAGNVHRFGVRDNLEEFIDRLLRCHIREDAAHQKRWCLHATGPLNKQFADRVELFGTSGGVTLQELKIRGDESRIPSPNPPAIVALAQHFSQSVQAFGTSAVRIVLGDDVGRVVERAESVGMGGHK